MSTPTLRSGLAALSILVGMFTLGITDNFAPYGSETGSLWELHIQRGELSMVFSALPIGMAMAGVFAAPLIGALGLLILLTGRSAGFDGSVLRDCMSMTKKRWFRIAVQAVGSIIGLGIVFHGHLLGDARYVTAFEYSLHVFARVWAWVLWGQTAVPLGIVLIAGAGVVINLCNEKAVVVSSAKLPHEPS